MSLCFDFFLKRDKHVEIEGVIVTILDVDYVRCLAFLRIIASHFKNNRSFCDKALAVTLF